MSKKGVEGLTSLCYSDQSNQVEDRGEGGWGGRGGRGVGGEGGKGDGVLMHAFFLRKCEPCIS